MKKKKRAEEQDRKLTDPASHVPPPALLTDLEHWVLNPDLSDPKTSPPITTPKSTSKPSPKPSGTIKSFRASIPLPPRPPLLPSTPLPPLNSLPKRLPPPKPTPPPPPPPSPPKTANPKQKRPPKEFNIFELLEPSDFELLQVAPRALPSPPPAPSPLLPPLPPSSPYVDSRPLHFSRRPTQEEKEPARSPDVKVETRPSTTSIPTSEPDPTRTPSLPPHLQPSPPHQSFTKVASSSFLLKTRWENKDHEIVPLIPTFLSAPPSSPSSTTSSSFPRPSSAPPSNTLESEILAQIQSRFEHLKPETPHVVHRQPSIPSFLQASRPSHPYSSHRSDPSPPRTKVNWPEDPPPPPPAHVAEPLVGDEITSTYLLGQQESRFFHEVRRRTGQQPTIYPSFEGGLLASSSSSPSPTPRDAAWSEVLDSTAEADAEASNSAYLEDQRRLGLLASHPDLEITSEPWKIVVSSPTTYGIPNKTSFPTAWLEDCDPTLLDSTTGRKRLDLDPPSNGIAVVTPQAGEAVEDDFLRVELGSKTVDIPLSFLAKQASEARRIEEEKKAAEEEASKSKSKPTPVVASKSNSLVVPTTSSTRIATFHFDGLTLSRKLVLKELESTGMITVRKGLKIQEGETREDALRRLVDVLGGVWRDEKLPPVEAGSDRLLEMDLLHLPSPPQYQILSSPTTPLSFIDTFSSALTLYHLQPHTFSSLVETSISHLSPPSSSSPSSSSSSSTPTAPSLPIITLSPSSTRLLKLWDSIASSSSRRPLPEIVAVNYSPSWRGTLPLGKEAGVAVAGMRLLQRLMRREEERRLWGGEGGDGEDVRIVRRDRWVVERAEEGGESWFMDLDSKVGVKEGETK